MYDFIKWAVEKYPADQYCLILWNHGSGWWGSPFFLGCRMESLL
ncbi:MAG: clostripain-related cysteine peptidase [Deltaproteobacteria bacterium]|nr:clostripain-related cysteine peptidase [Deltaproteobacteria bacterium]